jgi:hypothetical protein
MGLDAIICVAAARGCVQCQDNVECANHVTEAFDLTQSSGHYVQCRKDKEQGIGRVVLYDFHGLSATQSLVKLFRYQAQKNPPDHCFLDALEETFMDLIQGAKGDRILFVGQGSDRPVPLQTVCQKDNWFYPY